jgi:hypothetical protein
MRYFSSREFIRLQSRGRHWPPCANVPPPTVALSTPTSCPLAVVLFRHCRLHFIPLGLPAQLFECPPLPSQYLHHQTPQCLECHFLGFLQPTSFYSPYSPLKFLPRSGTVVAKNLFAQKPINPNPGRTVRRRGNSAKFSPDLPIPLPHFWKK